jgi:hypothetical protein
MSSKTLPGKSADEMENLMKSFTAKIKVAKLRKVLTEGQ